MGFWKNLFKPKKVIAATLIIGALVTSAVKIKQGLNEHKELQKDPIVQLSQSSLEEFILMMSSAEQSLEKNDGIGILESYQEFLKKKPHFEDTLFNKKHLDNLVEKGGITSQEREIMENMKSQFDKVFPELRFEAERIQGKIK